MPKLWHNTIEGHRREVRDTILDTAAALAAKHGLRSVTMAQIAEAAGIARATLYKYFSGVEEILTAWHQRQIAGHLEQLTALRRQPGDAGERLRAVLEAYALMLYENHGTELAAQLHQGEHVNRAHHHLHSLVRDLLAEAAQGHGLRTDVTPDELASYCLHALSAASSLPSKAAVRRLVMVTLAGLESPT